MVGIAAVAPPLTRPSPATTAPYPPAVPAVAADASEAAETVSSVVRERLRTLRSWLAATKGHGIWIGLWSLIGWGGTLLSPFLIEQPFLLMLMAPRALFVALAADSVGIVAFVLLGTIRLAMTDASYFILGRRFPRARERREHRRRTSIRGRVASLAVRYTDGACRWLCNHGLKAGTVLFFRPNAKYLAVAGSYGVSARVAGWSSVTGTMFYLASFHLGIGLLL